MIGYATTTMIFVLLTLFVDGFQRYPRIVHPRIITWAELLSRDRRSTKIMNEIEKEPNLQFVSLDEWILKTELNSQLVFSQDFKTEWRGKTRSSKQIDLLKSCESREGVINGWEKGSSRVILTRCQDDYYGLVHLLNRTFLLEPLLAGKHLLYEAGLVRSRRQTSSSSMFYEAGRRFYNMTGDTFNEENYDDNPLLLSSQLADLGRNNELEENHLELFDKDENNDDDEDGLGYFFDRNWQREKLPS